MLIKSKLKVIYLVLIVMMLFVSCTSTKVNENTYKGNMNNIVKKLGNNYQLRTYTVNRQYKYRYEVEPDYFKYFSEEEKNSDVKVYEYYWKKDKKTIYIWAKENEDGEIEAFDSVEYGDNIKF